MGSEWRKTSFAQLCDIKRGASPRPIQDWVASTGIPWIKISDANASRSRFITETRECIKVAGRSKSVSVYPGDLILSNSATPGIPKFLGIEACIHDGWLLLRNFRGLDKQFAYYLLLTQREALIGQGNGSVFTNLKTEILKNHEVTIPPLDEQQRIAEFLGWIDERLEIIHSTNTTLEAITQALFKSWFVDFDPVHAKAEGRAPEAMDAATATLFPSEFEESELGLIPKGWRVLSFGDAATLSKGTVNPLTTPDTEFEHYSLPAFDAKQMPVREAGEAIKSNKTLVPSGAVLVSKLNPHIPRIWPVGEVGANAVCSTEFLVWTPKAPASTAFVYCLASSRAFNSAMRQLVTGTSNSHQRVKPDQLKDIQVCVASDAALKAFATIASPLLQRIMDNRQQAATLASLRDTLLPRLISGKLRLPEVTEAAEAAQHDQ